MMKPNKAVTYYSLRSIFALGFMIYCPTSLAQSMPVFSGEYNCVINKNFDGFDAAYSNEIGVLSNAMLYLNFKNNTAKADIFLVNFGESININSGLNEVNSRLIAEGSIELMDGNIHNSKKLRLNMKLTHKPYLVLPDEDTVDFLIAPVNSGNTLLMQLVPEDGRTPITGVCQKI